MNTNIETMRNNSAKHILLKKNLIHLIEFHSRYEACRAQDATLAKALGVGLSTLQAAVFKLKKEEVIDPVTITKFKASANRYDASRVIYLNAEDRPVEEGALMLSTLIRDKGITVTSMKDRHLCGQLRCTPKQLDGYRKHAIEKEWLKHGVIVEGPNAGKMGYTSTHSFEQIPPPGRYFQEDKNLSPISDTLELVSTVLPDESNKKRLISLVKSFDDRGESCSLTVEEMADRLRLTPRWTKALRQELIASGHLFVAGRRQKRVLLTTRKAAAVPSEAVNALIVQVREAVARLAAKDEGRFGVPSIQASGVDWMLDRGVQPEGVADVLYRDHVDTFEKEAERQKVAAEAERARMLPAQVPEPDEPPEIVERRFSRAAAEICDFMLGHLPVEERRLKMDELLRGVGEKYIAGALAWAKGKYGPLATDELYRKAANETLKRSYGAGWSALPRKEL